MTMPDGAVTHRTEFGNQLVVDLDFSVANPITVIHSLGTKRLFISIVGLAGESIDVLPSLPTVNAQPVIELTDDQSLTLFAGSPKGVFRAYITVVPG